MKEYTEENAAVLDTDHRNLLSVAYKNVVGSRRSSWRVINSIMARSKDEGGQKYEFQKEYKAEIVLELKGICKEVLVCSNYLFDYF